MILISSLALFTSLFSYFLDYTFYDGSIFGRWLPYLAKKLITWIDKDRLNELEVIKANKEMYDNKLIEIAHGYFLYKILGGCLICSNVWHSVIVYNLLFCIAYASGHINGWWYLGILPFIFFSSFITRKISKND